MNKKQLEDRVDYLTVVVIGLVALFAVNTLTDWSMFYTQSQSTQSHTDILIKVQTWVFDHMALHEQLEEDVASNYKVIDQLIGVILRDEA